MPACPPPARLARPLDLGRATHSRLVTIVAASRTAARALGPLSTVRRRSPPRPTTALQGQDHPAAPTAILFRGRPGRAGVEGGCGGGGSGVNCPIRPHSAPLRSLII